MKSIHSHKRKHENGFHQQILQYFYKALFFNRWGTWDSGR